MQSAYRPTLALVFFGNETRPPSVGLDVRFWFQAMTFMLDCFLGSNCRRTSHHTACIQVRLPVDPLGPVDHSKRILAIIPLSSCFRR